MNVVQLVCDQLQSLPTHENFHLHLCRSRFQQQSPSYKGIQTYLSLHFWRASSAICFKLISLSPR